MQSGYVIAIDGPDGVGKTTQLELLRGYLEEKGRNVHVTRASGGTPIGEALRKVSLSDQPRPPAADVYISLAMYTALAEHLRSLKNDREIVLIDRSPLAMAAYNAYGSQLPDEPQGRIIPGRQHIMELSAEFFGAWGIDLLFYLDTVQDTIDARRERRAKPNDYFEQQDADFHHRVREGYEAGIKYLESLPGFPTKLAEIEASADISTIHHKIIEVVHAELAQLH